MQGDHYSVVSDLERAYVGGLLMFPNKLFERGAQYFLTQADFFDPLAGTAFVAMVDMYERGEEINPASLAAAVRGHPSFASTANVLQWMYDRLATANTSGTAAEWISREARRRRLQIAASETARALDDEAVDPDEEMGKLQQNIDRIEMPNFATLPKGAVSWDDWLHHSRSVVDDTPWVIPTMLRRQWRAMFTGPEGRGKSTLLRQIGMCASQGVHPLMQNLRFEPQRVLFVDLENRASTIRAQAALVDRGMRQVRDIPLDWSRLMLYHRVEKIDLRRRVDRVDLERTIVVHRPTLMILSPLYRTFITRSRDNYEEAAAEVQDVIDSLIRRYNLAVIIEHHAKAPDSTGAKRRLEPAGWAGWLRWPEFGIGLAWDKEKPGELELTRWRGDREDAKWPDKVERGQGWPWLGSYNPSPPPTPEDMRGDPPVQGGF